MVTIPPKPTIEEIFKETDYLPANKPLTIDEPVLLSLIDEEEPEEIDVLRAYLGKDEEEDIWIKAKTSISQDLVHKAESGKPKVELPAAFEDYRDVFEKEPSE